jgi:hypothetical protein
MTLRRYPLIILVPLLLLAGAPFALAEVRDNAGFFSKDAVRQANFDLKEIKRQHGKDLLIETYPSIPSNLQPQFNKLGEDAFYEQWARQSAQQAKTDGVAVLITKEPSHLQVVVGDKTREKAFALADRDTLRDELLASFRQKQYDQGLQTAVRTFRDRLNANLGGAVERSPGAAAGAAAAAGSSNAPQSNPGAFEPRSSRDTRDARGGGGFSFWKLIIWGIITLIVVRILSRLFTRRQAPQQAPGGGMFGQPGYDPRAGGPMGGGMGGFGTGLGGGLLGGLLGGWLGGRMFGGGGGGAGQAHGAPPPTAGGHEPGVFSDEHDSNFAGTGGSFGDDGGGDFGGGGGDFGGGGGSGGGGDF